MSQIDGYVYRGQIRSFVNETASCMNSVVFFPCITWTAGVDSAAGGVALVGNMNEQGFGYVYNHAKQREIKSHRTSRF